MRGNEHNGNGNGNEVMGVSGVMKQVHTTSTCITRTGELCTGVVQPAALTLQPLTSSGSLALGESLMATAFTCNIALVLLFLLCNSLTH